jgi:Di-haem oxidoreductase, putative peroxidase
MRTRQRLIGCVTVALAGTCVAQTYHPDIPKAWDDNEVARLEVPLAQRDRSPRYLTAAEYYALKVRTVYRSYPVYAPGRAPAGYLESLKQKEPEIIVFDASKLRTKEDWIRAGEAVFDDSPAPFPTGPAGFHAPPGITFPATREGIIPVDHYVIRQRGLVEQSSGLSCAACHTRVLPDGTALKGGQIDFAVYPSFAAPLRQADSNPRGAEGVREFDWLATGAPWVTPRAEFAKVTNDELARRYEAMPAGVLERQGTGSTHPVKVPSLIGIENVRYLDSTGLVRHRSIGDLMRYDILNTGLDVIAHFGDFQPSPSVAPFGVAGSRFSDEQLYALALYIYSLKPPPNPNPFDDRARRGQRIFEQQGCAGCHTPPFYTNNKLTIATGFKVPEDLRKTDDIMDVSVGTDPGLATETRRGTGFYKVPSLRGVWYRNAFSHSGQANTLEEWFDPARLREDYVAKGFHLAPGPIKGHLFGLNLEAEDRQALIAFLKTL